MPGALRDVLDDDHYEDAERGVSCIGELLEGYVVANDDPLKLGRVKAFVPGVFDESTDPERCSPWIYPLAAPGGGANQVGFYAPPVVGANVGVFFVMGDLEVPRYVTGPWATVSGADGVEAQDSPTFLNDGQDWLGATATPPTAQEAPGIRILEFAGMQLVFDPRPGLEKLIICDMARNPVTGAYLSAIVIDKANGALELKSTTAINIECEGAIKLKSHVGQIEFVFGDDNPANGEVAIRRLARVTTEPA